MNIRWLNENSRDFLEKDYLLPGQSVENRLQVIGDYAEAVLKRSCLKKEDESKFDGYSFKLQNYIANGWISLSTPLWTNFGTDRGLSISCFGIHIGDSVQDILDGVSEIGIMSKYGGGTAGYFGDVRPRGSVIADNGSSNGTKPFLELYQTASNVISQGSTRRGYFAGYINIDHGDIDEWLNIRAEGDPIQHITWGVTIPDWWITSMKEGDKAKRNIWAKVIQKKIETGLPYIIYTDNANKYAPDVYRHLGMKINHSQMCTEIFLPTDKNNSFVCDLSSMVDLYYDEWKNTDCVEVVTCLLDAAMTSFIEEASKIKHFEKAVNFAKEHRALGIGRMGYHSLLQSKDMAFEGLTSRYLNIEIQKCIYDQAYSASNKLYTLFGTSPMLEEYKRRHTTLIAIAPTISSSFIMQVSESIGLNMSNYYIKDLAKGKYEVKNIYLEKLLTDLNKNTVEVWDSIMKNHGSVLHLDFLTDLQKHVFKTAKEVRQEEIILQAAQRQKYIDQGQSLNLFISSETTPKQISDLMLSAHEQGLKSLYYQHNVNAAQILTKQLNCINCE